MNKLYLSFRVDLKNDDFINGPLFNRWLPDNENDAIILDAEHLKIKVWFERRGFMDLEKKRALNRRVKIRRSHSI